MFSESGCCHSLPSDQFFRKENTFAALEAVANPGRFGVSQCELRDRTRRFWRTGRAEGLGQKSHIKENEAKVTPSRPVQTEVLKNV